MSLASYCQAVVLATMAVKGSCLPYPSECQSSRWIAKTTTWTVILLPAKIVLGHFLAIQKSSDGNYGKCTLFVPGHLEPGETVLMSWDKCWPRSPRKPGNEANKMLRQIPWDIRLLHVFASFEWATTGVAAREDLHLNLA